VNTLHIISRWDTGISQVSWSAPFDKAYNRDRAILVDDPDDPYGVPIYDGPAWAAARALKPGIYTFWWREEY